MTCGHSLSNVNPRPLSRMPVVSIRTLRGNSGGGAGPSGRGDDGGDAGMVGDFGRVADLSDSTTCKLMTHCKVQHVERSVQLRVDAVHISCVNHHVARFQASCDRGGSRIVAGRHGHKCTNSQVGRVSAIVDIKTSHHQYYCTSASDTKHCECASTTPPPHALASQCTYYQ